MSYRPGVHFNHEEYGASGRIRTSDRSVRSRVLYPAELRMHYEILVQRRVLTTHHEGIASSLYNSVPTMFSAALRLTSTYPYSTIWCIREDYSAYASPCGPLLKQRYPPWLCLTNRLCLTDQEYTSITKSMVHPGGFEPPTARFVAEYSIQLSYGCIGNGGEGGIRTLDTAFDRILP